jgi:hypothetical protein
MSLTERERNALISLREEVEPPESDKDENPIKFAREALASFESRF